MAKSHRGLINKEHKVKTLYDETNSIDIFKRQFYGAVNKT